MTVVSYEIVKGNKVNKKGNYEKIGGARSDALRQIPSRGFARNGCGRTCMFDSETSGISMFAKTIA